MRQSVYYITLVILALLLASGCKKRDLMTDRQQMILFQYDFRNAAQHYGFIVDSEGNVFTYNNPGSWNFPDSDFEISQEEVAENTGKCVFSGIRIPDDELLKYTKVIDFIALSKVTAPRITDADKGTAQYICYQFEESSQKYKGHLIKTEGDVTRENLNFHSKRVYTWMKETGNGLSFD